jgi:hypothetical protein
MPQPITTARRVATNTASFAAMVERGGTWNKDAAN